MPNKTQFACNECDLLLTITELKEGEEASCPRCDHHVVQCKTDSVRRSIAISLSGLVLFIPAINLPIMAIEAAGQQSSASLLQAIYSLWLGELYFVAFCITFFCIFAPFVKLLSVFIVSNCMWFKQTSYAWLKPLFKFYHQLNAWEMLEVFMMGILISIIKLKDMAALSFDYGLICFILYMLSQVLMKVTLDKHLVWRTIHHD